MAIVNVTDQKLQKRWQDMVSAEMERTGCSQVAVIERIIHVMSDGDSNIQNDMVKRLARAEELNDEMLELLQGVVADAAAAQRNAAAMQRSAEAAQRSAMNGREDITARNRELERRITQLTGDLEASNRRVQEAEERASEARAERAEALTAKAEAEAAAAKAKGDADVQREWAAGLSRQVEALQEQVAFLRSLVDVGKATGAGGGSSPS